MLDKYSSIKFGVLCGAADTAYVKSINVTINFLCQIKKKTNENKKTEIHSKDQNLFTVAHKAASRTTEKNFILGLFWGFKTQTVYFSDILQSIYIIFLLLYLDDCDVSDLESLHIFCYRRRDSYRLFSILLHIT